MGSGVWAMHFIGMLSFHLPTPVSYDIPITLLSLLVAIVAAGFGLVVATRGTLSVSRLVAAGLLFGGAILSMHYIGMEAMRMQPALRYRASIVALSAAVAILAAMISLWSAFQLRLETVLSAFWKKVGSAVAMGTGIAGMHYTAMAATIFAPNSVSVAPSTNVDAAVLAGLIGAVTLLLLGGTLLISAYEAYRAARLEAHVRVLSTRLVESHDEERRSLAAELHDVVGQDIVAVNIQIALVRSRLPLDVPPDIREALDLAEQFVKRCIEALRSVMIELHPPGFEEFGLPGALHWHARSFEARSGLAVTVTVDEDVPPPAPRVAHTLLRVYLEALRNVEKHAHAKHTHVTLTARGEDFVLAVADDGSGFGADAWRTRDRDSGWGLMIMRERVRTLGGELRIISKPGAGTRIEVAVPRRRWS